MRLLASLALLSATLPNLPAASIVLGLAAPGLYSYNLVVGQGETITILQNQTIQFTGMSGVIGALGFNSFLNYTRGFTATTATFTQPNATPSTFAGGATFGSFEIDTPVSRTGLINYTINTSNGPITGQVLGPVAASAVPEPSTYALLSTGLAALWAFRRQRRS